MNSLAAFFAYANRAHSVFFVVIVLEGQFECWSVDRSRWTVFKVLVPRFCHILPINLFAQEFRVIPIVLHGPMI